MVADVAVAAAIYAIDRPYSYYIPPEFNIQPGMRVVVPFGRGNRSSEGIVLGVSSRVEEGLKPISEVLDTESIVSDGFIRMAAFIRDRYFCTFYDAVKAMLPAGLWFQSTESYLRTDKSSQNTRLTENEKKILSIFDAAGGPLTRTEISSFCEKDFETESVLQSLLSKKFLKQEHNYSRRVHDKTETMVSLAVPAEQAIQYAEQKRFSAPIQYEFLRLLCSVGSGGSKELCYLSGATKQTIRRLECLGIVSVAQCEVFRSSLPICVEQAEPITLSEEQQTVYNNLLEQSEQSIPGVGLLYGVTGSGKTAIYLKLIDRMLQNGKSAIVMVPEIALTPQLVQIFMSHFGNTVSVLHSALRMSERYDTWKKIKMGESRVVIGTRSAVFAPVRDLGLLIVDEEQEHSYKSENIPRYHAREVAIYRGHKENALVLLGSATPSIESMYYAQTGFYTLNKLTSRYNGKYLPSVEIVDMKEELRRGNNTDISELLYNAISDNLANGKQSILFLNRRGAGQCIICVDCGDVPQCPKCSVSLTYHKANHRLMCHHCGHSESAPTRCDKCGGHRKIVGTGTQKVEAELHELFPEVKTVRMDADTISASNTHEMIIRKFQEERIPILIGTQMVTKGLNFDDVTLVGVIDADMSLYVNHFRATETTFSMLTQVVGRSGRGSCMGKAIIQTMTPEHTVIQLSAKQDYETFYELETTLRNLQKSPPYADIFTLTFSGIYEDDVVRAAHEFKRELERYLEAFPMQILGPSPAAILKVNLRYRYKINICCENSRELRLMLSSLLKTFGKNKKFKGVTAFIDVNSYE